MFIAVTLLAGLAILFAVSWFLELRARLRFERWKAEHTQTISRKAIAGSQAAVSGRVFERVAPYLPGFGFNPRDVRFIGDPVDFVVFDGLSEGALRQVVFVEVKTGGGRLNGNESAVQSVVDDKQVRWSMYRVEGEDADGTAGKRPVGQRSSETPDGEAEAPTTRLRGSF